MSHGVDNRVNSNGHRSSFIANENYYKKGVQPHYISQANKEKIIGIRTDGNVQNAQVLNSGAMTPIKKLSGNFF